MWTIGQNDAKHVSLHTEAFPCGWTLRLARTSSVSLGSFSKAAPPPGLFARLNEPRDTGAAAVGCGGVFTRETTTPRSFYMSLQWLSGVTTILKKGKLL